MTTAEDAPSLHALSLSLPTQQRAAIASDPFRLVHRGKEFAPDFDISTCKGPNLLRRESEPCQEEVRERLLLGRGRAVTESDHESARSGRTVRFGVPLHARASVESPRSPAVTPARPRRSRVSSRRDAIVEGAVSVIM